MAGIYIHIPFCKQACHYCDFHFSTHLKRQHEVVEALCKEIHLQKEYLGQEVVETIYLGGGTPSLLTTDELTKIFDSIYATFQVVDAPEVTLEANPDDVTPRFLASIQGFPVNRLSIGIQSFHEPHLRYLNRIHSASEAENCVQYAQDAGFENITIDLIYAIPYPDHSVFIADLQKAIDLGVPHISAYSLTIEPQTAFGSWMKKGKIPPIDEDFSADQFEILLRTLTAAGFEQYEISNFAKLGWESKHNSNYWKKRHYLGIGPSAHSYNGSTRQFNVAQNTQYLTALAAGTIPYTLERLTLQDQVNEYILTSLRTKWGCDTNYIQSFSGYQLLTIHHTYITTCLANGWLVLENGLLKLTISGKLLADQISSLLFIG